MTRCIDQFLIIFFTFVALRLAETAFSRRPHLLDETTGVKGRLSPVVADLLDKSKANVMRISGQRQTMFAQTRLFFPSNFIIIDYSERQVAGQLEDFIIVHELAHYRHNHPLLKIVLESLFTGGAVTLAIELSIGRPLVSAIVIALPIILVGCGLLFPLNRFITRGIEDAADRFAAKILGSAGAREQMTKLKDLIPESNRVIRDDLDQRIIRLQQQANKTRMLAAR